MAERLFLIAPELLRAIRERKAAMEQAREDYRCAVQAAIDAGVGHTAIGRACGQTEAASRMLAKRASRRR